MAGQERQKESSVLFSLRELMDLEEQRCDEEKTQEETARLENERLKMEAEFKRLASDEARRREVEGKRAADRAALRAEEARLEAMKLAAVERARLEGIERARLDEMSQEQKHQRDLAAIKSDVEKRRYKRVAVIGTGVFTMALGVTLGWWLGIERPRAEAIHAQQEHEIQVAMASAEVAKQLLADKQRERDGLQRELDEAKTERERIDLQQKIDRIDGKDPKPSPTTPIRDRNPKPDKKDPSQKPCNPKDPMDACLPGSG